MIEVNYFFEEHYELFLKDYVTSTLLYFVDNFKVNHLYKFIIINFMYY